MQVYFAHTISLLLLNLMVVAPARADLLLSWKQEPASLALMNGEDVLWKFNAKRGIDKPFFHPLATADGNTLTQERPADHVWHHGLWFCFKEINGVNFWEENKETGLSAGHTILKSMEAQKNPDFSAYMDLDLRYQIPGENGQPARDLIKERRKISVSAPDDAGNYHIDFHHYFTALEDVVLDRTPLLGESDGKSYGGYAGLSFRHFGHPENWQIRDQWKFIAPNAIEDEEKKVHGSRQPWVAYSGELGNGSAATAMFDHPSNAGFPTKWYTSNGLVFYSPAFIFDKAMKLANGESLTLRYRVKIYSMSPSEKELGEEFSRFEQKEFSSLGGLPPVKDTFGKMNLVTHGRAIYAQHCAVCHSNKPDGEAGDVIKLGPTFYGLFKNTPEKHVVFQEKALTEVLADGAYLKDSIYEPTKHLAAKENPDGSMVAYPPAMPRYKYQGDDLDALLAFLKTLNKPGDRGPAAAWITADPKAGIDNAKFEIIPQDRPRIVRAIFPNVSTRAIAVGDPTGVHYMFDPAWLSIRQVWMGGFVNVKVEHTDRAAGENTLGKDAKILDYGELMRPLSGDEPINFSDRDFLVSYPFAIKQLKADLETKGDLFPKEQANSGYLGYRLENDRPTFLFKLDGVQVEQTVEPKSDGRLEVTFQFSKSEKPIRFQLDQDKASFTISAGTIAAGVLSLPANTTSLKVTISSKSL
jgi:hypothetical protein